MPTKTKSELFSDYWDEDEFAEVSGHSVPTLRRWRRLKIGPPITKFGRMVLYGKESAIKHLKTLEQHT